MPLALTVTVATVGVAAWIWNQRKDDKTEELEASEAAAYQDLDYENADYGDNPAYGATGENAGAKPSVGGAPGDAGYGAAAAESSASGWGAQMSGALRRTPSPQQFLDSAKRTVIGGVTAAGAVVGSALAAIREEDKTAYADHETWSEEADAKKEKIIPPTLSKDAAKRRKKVVIVISADNHLEDTDSGGYHEHAVSRQSFSLHLEDVNMEANTIGRPSYPIFRVKSTTPRSSCIFSSMLPNSAALPRTLRAISRRLL